MAYQPTPIVRRAEPGACTLCTKAARTLCTKAASTPRAHLYRAYNNNNMYYMRNIIMYCMYAARCTFFFFVFVVYTRVSHYNISARQLFIFFISVHPLARPPEIQRPRQTSCSGGVSVYVHYTYYFFFFVIPPNAFITCTPYLWCTRVQLKFNL